ncbi:hypothetical protein FMK20_28150, partial [Klebsiella grimontii]|nr:hypothetical protein [Klebsiella grimontii]
MPVVATSGKNSPQPKGNSAINTTVTSSKTNIPTLTRLRGLAPRHLRAAILSFFVHAQNWTQTASHMGLKVIKCIKKIVQFRALSCKVIFASQQKVKASITLYYSKALVNYLLVSANLANV